MAVLTYTTTFDPAKYVAAVTALGFDPFIACLPNGRLQFREETPWPIPRKVRRAYWPWFDALWYTPGAVDCLVTHLLETLRIKRGEYLS